MGRPTAGSLLLVVTSLSLVLVSCQSSFKQVSSLFHSSSSSSVQGFSMPLSLFSSEAFAGMNDLPSPQPRSARSSTGQVLKSPVFKVIVPKGVHVTVPGPHEPEYNYQVTFRINVNEDVEAPSWEKTVSYPPGRGSWLAVIRGVPLTNGDMIHYRVKVKGTKGGGEIHVTYSGTFYIDEDTPRVRLAGDSTPAPETTNPPISSLPWWWSEFTTSAQLQPPSTTTTTMKPTTHPTTTTTSAPVNTQPSSTAVAVTHSPTKKPVEQCAPSLSTYNYGKQPCKGGPFVDHMKFSYILQIGGPEDEDVFTVFYNKGLSHDKRRLSITPSLLEDYFGAGFVDKSLELTNCTNTERQYCSVQASGYKILPPVMSTRIVSNLHFRYGTVEVAARMPRGDWIVSEIWMMPKTRVYGQNSGRIVLAKSRGNDRLSDGILDYSNRVVEMGVEVGDQPRLFRVRGDSPWSDDYHNYRLVWTPDTIKFYVDGNETGSIDARDQPLNPSLKGTKLAPFDQEFSLVFGIHVAGDKDFPDDIKGKPWDNYDTKRVLNFWQQRTAWYPSWSKESSLDVDPRTLHAL